MRDQTRIETLRLLASHHPRADRSWPPTCRLSASASCGRAFDRTMIDPAFLDDAKRSGMDVKPISGAAMQALVDGVVHSSPADTQQRCDLCSSHSRQEGDASSSPYLDLMEFPLRGAWSMKAVSLSLIMAVTATFARGRYGGHDFALSTRTRTIGCQNRSAAHSVAERQAKAMAASVRMDRGVAGSFTSRISSVDTGSPREQRPARDLGGDVSYVAGLSWPQCQSAAGAGQHRRRCRRPQQQTRYKTTGRWSSRKSRRKPPKSRRKAKSARSPYRQMRRRVLQETPEIRSAR